MARLPDLLLKTPDKNGQLRGARKGDKRGPRLENPSEPHKTRPVLRASEPVHIIMKAHEDVGSLHKRELVEAVREALVTVARLEESFRITHFNVLRAQLHLLVEAKNRLSLAKGMQVFGISAAMHVNARLVGADGRRRRGPVFPDRYHARILHEPGDYEATRDELLASGGVVERE